MTNYNGYDREDLLKEIERLRGQRDELLESLINVMSWIDNWSPNFIEDSEWPSDCYIARDAIAKAEESP